MMKCFPAIACIALIFLVACNDEGGSADPSSVAAKPFDWNNAAYDWAVTLKEDCKARGYDFWSFPPRTAVMVFGATEKYLLLCIAPNPSNGNLYRYDLQTRELTSIWPHGFEWAQLSPDGTTVALRSGTRSVVFVDPETGTYSIFTASGDSVDRFKWYGLDVRWLPDSRSVLGYFRMKDGRDEAFLLSAEPPHIMTPYSKREALYTYFADTRDIFFNQEVRGVKTHLEIRRIGDTTLIARTRMPKGFYAMGMQNGGEVSPDGKWLAAPVQANLAMTRLSHLDIMDGLGIFDLREGSPTQYQLYRFIGDHMHFYRNCLYPYELSYDMSAVWSHDSKYLYHERLFMSDSTMQVVRYDFMADTAAPVTHFWR